MAEKKTKAEVDYGPAKSTSRERCRNCEHFERPSSCELVQGHINMGDWCRLWKAARRG